MGYFSEAPINNETEDGKDQDLCGIRTLLERLADLQEQLSMQGGQEYIMRQLMIHTVFEDESSFPVICGEGREEGFKYEECDLRFALPEDIEGRTNIEKAIRLVKSELKGSYGIEPGEKVISRSEINNIFGFADKETAAFQECRIRIYESLKTDNYLMRECPFEKKSLEN